MRVVVVKGAGCWTVGRLYVLATSCGKVEATHRDAKEQKRFRSPTSALDVPLGPSLEIDMAAILIWFLVSPNPSFFCRLIF